MNNKLDASFKNIRDFMYDLDYRSKYLLASSILVMVSLGLIIIFILPSLGGTANTNKGISIEKADLAYIIKYAKKINAIKSSSAVVTRQPASPEGEKGYIKSLYAMTAYFGIQKNSIKKLTGSYSKDDGNGSGGSSQADGGSQGNQGNAPLTENVSVKLRGITLNELVDVIYGIYSSGYPVKFDSIKVGKNFDDKKLLNLDLALERKITRSKSGKTAGNKK